MVNFAQSHSTYFLILSDLGLSLYCVKKVNQSDSSNLIIDKVFSIKFILSTISTILFFISINFILQSNFEKMILYGIGVSIFFSRISIDYLFNSLNHMKYMGISIAVKNIIFFILCIVFVKSKQQTNLFSIFYTLGIFVAFLILL
ncbi:oligosaccharide flippase family protein [Clostridium perfringens]|uniref:oligosaccharide flippase family protein n=1 Tax=Clostridium perfringens TaxID=1502 RepID=UPI003C6C87EC